MLKEELSPEGEEELNNMSFEDLLAFGDESAGDESSTSSGGASERIDERRWLKLAGLLKG